MARVSDALSGAGSVSAGVSTAVLAAANPSRTKLVICNDHATQVLYLGLGTAAVASKGIRITAGTCYTLEGWSGAVNVIASGASTVATFVEF